MTAKSTEGVVYEIDPKKQTAKVVSKSLKALRHLPVDEVSKVSMEQYYAYLNEHFPTLVTRKKNMIDIKGYRFMFTPERIVCRDLQKFGHEVDLGIEFPTPTEIGQFLENKEMKRVFSPAELKKAHEEGKRILDERKKVPVAELPKIITTEELKKQKEKALRLISRIESRQADSDRLFEIPASIENRELRVSLSWAFKAYLEKKLRWPLLIERIREILLKEETGGENKVQPKFIGLDPVRWSNAEQREGKFYVDGKIWSYGEFVAKYMLARDRYPKLMPQIMRYLRGEMSAAEMLEHGGRADRKVPYDEALLKKITPEQAAQLDLLLWEQGEYTPLQKRYLHTDGQPFKKGTKLKVVWFEWPGVFEGRVVGFENGVQLDYGGEIKDLLIHQDYEIVSNVQAISGGVDASGNTTASAGGGIGKGKNLAGKHTASVGEGKNSRKAKKQPAKRPAKAVAKNNKGTGGGARKPTSVKSKIKKGGKKK